YGLGAMLAVTGLVEAERSRGWKAPGPVLLLGVASYSIYLVHLNVVTVAAKVMAFAGVGSLLPGIFIFIALVIIGVVAGLAYYFVVERPTLAFLRQLGPASTSIPSKRPREA